MTATMEQSVINAKAAGTGEVKVSARGVNVFYGDNHAIKTWISSAAP